MQLVFPMFLPDVSKVFRVEIQYRAKFCFYEARGSTVRMERSCGCGKLCRPSQRETASGLIRWGSLVRLLCQ